MFLLNNLSIGLFLVLCSLVSGQDDPCPAANDILPCTCSGTTSSNTIIDCSTATNENEIATAFQANFPESNLYKFEIVNNEYLTSLSSNLFGIISFQHIVITNTIIQSIYFTFFESSFNHVTYIHCPNNQITDFPFDAFQYFTLLDDVLLDSNAINYFPKLSSSTLNYLSLTSNQIEEIEDFAFRDCPNLATLYLNGNAIGEIKSSAFIGAHSLATIYLSSNSITSIRTGAFSYLSNLMNIYINNNPLSDIETGAFTNLASLDILYMEYNKLQDFKGDFFYDVPSLQRLLSYGSTIQNIAPFSLTFYESTSVDVRFYDNQIEIIENFAFSGLHGNGTGIVRLERNLISEIQVEAFTDFTGNELYLNDNNLITLDEKWLGPILLQGNSIYLEDNPLECGCDLAWLFQNPQFLDQILDDPRCHSNGVALKDLDPNYYLDNC